MNLEQITEIRDFLLAEGVMGMISGSGLKLWYGSDGAQTAVELSLEDLWSAEDPVGHVKTAAWKIIMQSRDIMEKQGIEAPPLWN